jgi:hypothetical protein
MFQLVRMLQLRDPRTGQMRIAGARCCFDSDTRYAMISAMIVCRCIVHDHTLIIARMIIISCV